MTSKLILMAQRKEDLTHIKCIEYLEHEHAPLVTQLPGLEQFTTAVPLDPEQVGSPLGSNAVKYDVLAPLEFESLDDLREAFKSESGRQVRQDATNFVDVDESVTIPISDETLQYRAIPANL